VVKIFAKCKDDQEIIDLLLKNNDLLLKKIAKFEEEIKILK
jgi:hypothetical protein